MNCTKCNRGWDQLMLHVVKTGSTLCDDDSEHQFNFKIDEQVEREVADYQEYVASEYLKKGENNGKSDSQKTNAN